MPATQALVEEPPAEPAHAAAIAFTLKLSHTEGRILAALWAREYATREELCRIAAFRVQSVALGSLGPTLTFLRRKLTGSGIEIVNVRGLGYALTKKSREKIGRLLAQRDASPDP